MLWAVQRWEWRFGVRWKWQMHDSLIFRLLLSAGTENFCLCADELLHWDWRFILVFRANTFGWARRWENGGGVEQSIFEDIGNGRMINALESIFNWIVAVRRCEIHTKKNWCARLKRRVRSKRLQKCAEETLAIIDLVSSTWLNRQIKICYSYKIFKNNFYSACI